MGSGEDDERVERHGHLPALRKHAQSLKVRAVASARPQQPRAVAIDLRAAHESSDDRGARIRRLPSAGRLPPSRLPRSPDLRFDRPHRCTARLPRRRPALEPRRQARTATEPKRRWQPLDRAHQVSRPRSPEIEPQAIYCIDPPARHGKRGYPLREPLVKSKGVRMALPALIGSREQAGRNAPYRWARRNRSTSASRTSSLRSPG